MHYYIYLELIRSPYLMTFSFFNELILRKWWKKIFFLHKLIKYHPFPLRNSLWKLLHFASTGVMQLSLVSILSELMGDTWCRLKVGSGLSFLRGILFMSCFSKPAFEFSATERELGKVEFLELSHFCFLRRYAARTSLLRRTWMTKMKNP